MSSQNLLAITMVLSVVLGISYSYAEIATVEVPFESNGLTCSYNDDLIEYHCIWQGSKQKPITLEELETFEDVLTEEQYEEAVEDITEELVVVKDDPPTYEERVIERIERQIERGKASSADLDLLESLKKVNECRRGLGNSAPVQTEGAWASPLLKPDTYGDAYDYKTNYLLGKIVKAYEECQAQYILEQKTLGSQYGNMIIDDSTSQAYHATMHKIGDPWYDTFIATPEELNAHDFHKAEENAFETLCEALHTKAERYDYGCLKKPELPQSFIIYKNPIYESYAKFINGDESEQLQKNIYESLSDKVRVSNNYGGQQ